MDNLHHYFNFLNLLIQAYRLTKYNGVVWSVLSVFRIEQFGEYLCSPTLSVVFKNHQLLFCFHPQTNRLFVIFNDRIIPVFPLGVDWELSIEFKDALGIPLPEFTENDCFCPTYVD